MDIGLWEVGAKRQLNRVRNTDTKKSCSVRRNSPQNNLVLRGDFTPVISFPIWDHFFPFLFPKGFKISKIFGHPTLENRGKKTFKRYFKSEQTHRLTNRHTHIWTNRLIESNGPEGRCFENTCSCLTKAWLL